MSSGNTLQTACPPSGQAALLLQLPAQMTPAPPLGPYTDPLDHLKDLEEEARLILARALLRRAGPKWEENADDRRAVSTLGLSPGDFSPEMINNLLSDRRKRTLAREEATFRSGKELKFCTLCTDHGLDAFDRSAVLFLLLFGTSRTFSETVHLCGLGERNCHSEDLTIGSLLSILCADYREELERRARFSVDSPLMRAGILDMSDTDDEMSNLLEEAVCLPDRIVRFCLGDGNRYGTSFSFIRRERSDVSLDQVVMPGEIKAEVVAHVAAFLKRRELGTLSDEIDRFYGYGSGLALLFHGPSGVGKTMLAQALARHFDRQLFSLTMEDMRRTPMSNEEILAHVFQEATLNGAFVFFDECDDLFVNNSRSSRSMLIEMEKARCVIILATNKPVDLDPAMERRITLKVPLHLPDVTLRREMWMRLLPPFIETASDVDFDALAERYLFSGGLIRNSISLAVNTALASSLEGKPVLTQSMLEHGAETQALSFSDTSGLCTTYTPARRIAGLPLQAQQREELGNIGRVFERLKERGLGLNVLVSGTDIETGIHVAEALAADCGLKVRAFDYERISSTAEEAKLMDPVTQRRVSPLAYAFSAGTGSASLTLLVDHDGVAARMFDSKEDGKTSLFLADLASHLRGHRGLFCLVTKSFRRVCPLVELNLHIELEYPPEEVQMRRWERLVGGNGAGIGNDDLVDLVERYPMYEAEIDFIARQAAIQSLIKGKGDPPALSCILDVIARHSRSRNVPVLFGNE